MPSIKKLVGQTAVYGFSTILGRLLNYLLVPLHTYLFQPAQYGIVGELYAWVSLFVVILTYGMETAFFRFSQIDEYKNKCYSTAIVSLFTTSVIFSVLCSCFAQPIAGWMQYGNHPEYITWIAIIISIDALTSIFFASLRLQMKAVKFAVVKITNILVNILLNLFFLLLCPYLLKNGIATEFLNTIYDPEIGVGYIFIANLAASIVTLVMLAPDIFKIRVTFSWSLWRKMFAYAFPLLILGLAGIVNETMDRVLLKNLSPAEIAQSQVGIYSACYKISIMMTIFIQAFKYAAEPFFFSKSKDADAKATYAVVMKYFVLCCAVMFLGIMLYIDIVKYFVGPEYHQGLVVVPILLLANLFLGIFYNLSIWYKLTGQTRFGAYIALIGAAITLGLNYLLIPVIGYLGSAWATFACYFCMMVLSYILGQKYYHVNYQIGKILFSIAAAVAIYYGSTFLPIENFSLKMVVNTCLLIGYIFVIILAERKNFREDFK
ncbi:MAG: oligosaccharide flippase family protein [Bacteroidales bacterium]|jgi:O-antigen/teichoic acid export membrane protein|nr:oligosaccharide flippase family protein [Bacteroidales bacterium]